MKLIEQFIKEEMLQENPNWNYIRTMAAVVDKHNDRMKMPRDVNLTKLEQCAASVLHIDVEQIRIKTRLREIAYARFFIWHFLVRKKYWRLETAGLLYGYHHASVINGIKNVDNIVYNDDHYKKAYENFVKLTIHHDL